MEMQELGPVKLTQKLRDHVRATRGDETADCIANYEVAILRIAGPRFSLTFPGLPTQLNFDRQVQHHDAAIVLDGAPRDFDLLTVAAD
jgi:hypothetical protein